MRKWVVVLLVLSGGAISLMLFRDTAPMEAPHDEMSKRSNNATNATAIHVPTKIHKNKTFPISIHDYLAQELNASTLSSPACQPRLHLLDDDDGNQRPIQRIFFLHMRKAGGTVIRKYLQKVSKQYGILYVAREGRKTVEHPMDPHTLYVTNLREPNARTISHYKYDQRWACNNLRHQSFQPSLNNTRQSFETFLRKADRNNKRGTSLWTCATNCYTRWASGNYKPLLQTCSNQLRKKEVTRIRQAHLQLSKYNFIFVSERLRDRSYIEKVENMFGVKGLARRKVYPVCAKASENANSKFPLVVSNETRQYLQDCNTPDTALYRQLTTCPQGFDFTHFNMRSLYKSTNK